MNINDIQTNAMLNGVIEQSKSMMWMLDITEKGVVSITKGEKTNTEAFWDELSKFFLYIAFGNQRITEQQAAFFNLLQKAYADKPFSDIKDLEDLANEIIELNGADSLIVKGFNDANIVGEQLAFPFDLLGRTMIDFDSNPESQKRYDDYLDELSNACDYKRVRV